MEHFDPIQLYFKEIKAIPTIPPDRLKLIWKRALRGDKRSQKRIVEANLRLVIPIAKRFCRTGIEFLDLIEEGNMGLMRAVEKFNPHKKTQFSTYATYWIEQSVRRAIEEKSKTIRIPPHIWDAIHHWLKNWKPLKEKLGRDPTMQEMGKKLHMTTHQIKNVMAATQLTQGISSLETPIDADGSLFIKDIISDHGASPESVTDITRALDLLAPREKVIIELRFGLNNTKPQSLEEIGAKLKLSRERIRQLEERALQRLKVLAVKVKLVELKDSKALLLDSRNTRKDRRATLDRRANKVDRRVGLPDTRTVKTERRSGRDRRMTPDRRLFERRR
jgi:RNA polymerase sigma factor (sigma-70 family)